MQNGSTNNGFIYEKPTLYFPNIDFNYSFYDVEKQYITKTYADNNYLLTTGGAITNSMASSTYFNGTVGIGTMPAEAGSLNAKTLKQNNISLDTFLLFSSNYTFSNILNTSNYVQITSNILMTTMNIFDNNSSNYSKTINQNTSNLLQNYFLNSYSDSKYAITANPNTFANTNIFNGSIGINTSAPQTRVHMYDTAFRMSGIGISNPADTNSVTLWHQLGVGGSMGAWQLSLCTNGNSECMRLNQNQNVGICSSSPQYRLDVNGDINSSTQILEQKNPISVKYGLWNSNYIFNLDAFNSNYSKTNIQNTSNLFQNYMLSSFTSNYIQQIDSNSKTNIQNISNLFQNYVSSGLTSNYIKTLDTFNSNYNLILDGFSSNYSKTINQNTSNLLQNYYVGTYSDGKYPILVNPNTFANTNIFNGSIGINTSAPQTRVHMYDTAFRMSGVGISNPADTNSVTFWHQLGVGGSMGAWQLSLCMNGNSECMRLNQNQNVGICSSSPQYCLDVNGDINTSTQMLEQKNPLSVKYGTWNSNYTTMLNNQTSNLFVNYQTSNSILFSSNYYSNVSVFNSNAYFQNKTFINDNLYASNIWENGINLQTKYLRPFRLYINTSKFYYDGTNSLYTYDLNIKQYLPALTTKAADYWGPIKTRIFEIQTTMVMDFQNIQFWNYGHRDAPSAITVPYCAIEKYTIYMSNAFYDNATVIAKDNYCNFVIYGKEHNETNIGYWTPIKNNFNYIRFLTPIGWSIYVNVLPILYNA